MKKSLIALAALAAFGTASAQSTVSLTGKLRFAYESLESTSSSVKTKASGLKVTDGDFALTATEDLGGGLKATAFMNVLSRGRDTSISGRDASISLAGGFGSVLIGSIEAGNGIIGLGGAGAPVYGMDGSVIAGASNVDIIKYTTLALAPGLTASFSLTDNTAVSTNLTTGGTLGLNSTALAQDSTVLGLNYANGPLTAAFDMTAYGRNAVTGTVLDDRTRVSANYNLGMATVGFGYQTLNTTATSNNTTKDTIIGVAVPLGAITLGLNYATSKVEGNAYTVKGTDLGAKYDLSKRTYIAAHYQKVSNKDNGSELGASDVGGTSNSNNKFRIQLAHSF